jgi:hypothetical protein
MASQQFYVNGRYLGQRDIPNFFHIPGMTPRPHFGYAYFCLRCGDVWGRLVVVGAALTQVVGRPCQKHGDGRLSYTHFFEGEPYNLEHNWPPAAIRYEFECELALATRDATPSPGFAEILEIWGCAEKEAA